MAGEIKKVLFSEGLTVDAPSSSPFDVGDYADFDEVAAPATPDAGIIRVYAKTDGNLYKKDSAGVESQVGSGAGGSGEKNYIENPSGTDDAAAAVPTGWANVGDLDIVVTKTAADLPREYTTGAGLKITADANTQSVSDYVYYDFSLDDVDLSKKLKIQWSQKTTGTYAAGDLAVVITTQADRTTALHTPITTAIPAADGVFTTYFDASTTATLSLVIRATTDMTTDGGIVISDVIVGPGIQPQGAVVEDTKSVTFTGSWVSNTTYTAKETRVGNWAQYEVKIATSGAPTSAELSLTLPTGRTIDTTKLADTTSGSSNPIPNSTGRIYDYGTAIYLAGVVYVNTTTVAIQYCDDAAGGVVTNNPVSQAAPMTFANNDTVTVSFRVPIAEWAGSGTVNLAQNDVEYVSNSGTGATGDITNYAYGPNGSLIPSVSSSGTTAQAYQVKFATPRQTTDLIIAEFMDTTTNAWFTLPQRGWQEHFNDAGTTGYGVYFDDVGGDTTKLNINFYQAPSKTVSWATLNGGGFRWRVRKISGGQAVGHGLADTTSSGLAPFGVFRAGEQGNLALQEKSATPSDPTSSAEAKIYLKSDKLVIQFNDAGTVRYKYLDLTGTGVTWVHTTSAP